MRYRMHKYFEWIRGVMPTPVSNFVRSAGTAVMTPILFSRETGHFKSSFKMAAVDRQGLPLPWYTYPCIDFLRERTFSDKTVLEFGGGQSSLWWAKRAKRVVVLEGDPKWLKQLESVAPENVELHLVSVENASACVEEVRAVLNKLGDQKYDVAVIDGLYRGDMVDIALEHMSEDGAIFCDDAHGYGFFEGFEHSGLLRVDFFGNAPGVVLPRSTSMYFAKNCFLTKCTIPIPKEGRLDKD